MQTHSLMQAAGLLGVNKTTLQTWLSQGCPAVERGDRSTGTPWQINIADVMQWRIDRAVADAVSAYGGNGTEMSHEEADRRRAIIQMRAAAIDLDEKLKLVVLRADAVADMAAFCQVLKTGLSNAASKIAARGTAITVATEIEAMAKAEMNRAFRAAREELRRLWEAREAEAAPEADPEAEPAQRP